MAKKASIQRLQFCNFKLDVILNITQKINQNPPIRELLEMYEKLLRNELNIGKAVLFQYSRKWEVLMASGLSAGDYDTISVTEDLSAFEEITPTSYATNRQVRAFDIIIPVFHENTPIAFVLLGDIEEEKEGISPTIKHVHFIRTVTNIIIVSIENKRLYQQNLRQEAIRKELELASRVQNMLVPDKSQFPDNENLRISSYYRPHLEVGGDYYDYIKLNDNEVGFCIADVSGKGMSAAMLMSNFQASLRALFNEEITLRRLILRLNKLVWNNTYGDRFITLFIARYNITDRKLTYVNAGHNPPVIYDKTTGHYKELEKGSVGLGMLDEIPALNVGQLPLNNPHSLLCFTDGLAEMQNDEGNEVGNAVIQEQIQTDASVNELIPRILRKLNIYDGNNRVFDDIAILGVDFK